MNIAIVGGGKKALTLIDRIQAHPSNVLSPELVAVAHLGEGGFGPKAVPAGVSVAREPAEALTREDIDLIIDLSEDPEVRGEIEARKGPSTPIIDAQGLPFFEDLLRRERPRPERGSPLQSRAMFDVIMNELIHEDVMVIASDYRVLDINDTMLRKLGLRRDEAIGRYCHELTHHQNTPCSGEEHPCPLLQTMDSRKPSQTTHVHLDKDNEKIFYSISCYPLLEEDRVVGAIEISRDITKDINLQKLMMQQEKLASIGRLSAGVAHEINNPLTTILTTALLIQEDIEAEDPMFEDLETIARETLRCRKIVTSLLDFARQTKPEKREHNINDIVRESILLTKKQAAFTDVTVDYNISGELPPLYVDKGQIQQALINLVLNAVEATEAGGEVTVQTRTPASRNEVRILIRDTGHGISQEDLDNIFDPFFTTKESGTGLGLAITHGIIEQHGGTIEVESTVGQGTTFTITLPAAESGQNG